ncbi:MAG: DUF4352 domain-containing protein [Candidatus Hydrothermarchaeales archaeon]
MLIRSGKNGKIALLLLCLTLTLGCITPAEEDAPPEDTIITPPPSTPVSKPVLITKNPRDMALGAGDVPSDFSIVSSSGDNASYFVTFAKEGNIGEFLTKNPSFKGILWIWNSVMRYDSVEDAVSAFNAFERESGTLFLSRVRYDTIGDDALLVERADDRAREFELLFRKRNVVSGVVVLGTDGISRDEAVRYSKIIEGRATLPSDAPTAKTRTLPLEYGGIGEEAGREGHLYLKVNDFQIMNSFKNPYGSTYEPKPGMKFVAVEVTVISSSTDLIRTHPQYMELLDADENSYEVSSYYADYPGFFDSSNINPGERGSGFVLFEIPTTAAPDLLIYDDGVGAVGIRLVG